MAGYKKYDKESNSIGVELSMETYIKKFMRQLLKHKDSLNEYVDELYSDESRDEDLNDLFSELKKQGFINCMYADNRAYNVQLTIKGKNISASELRLSNKEELLELIGQIGDIEKYFHKMDGQWAMFEQIHDVPEYQEWIQQIIFYLQDIFDKTTDLYIQDTVNLCKRHMNGTDDRKRFIEISGKLKSIEKNIDKYFENSKNEGDESSLKAISKTPMIFISHSSKDEKHVELIVKLLKDMGFTKENVFCSSVPGYGIKLSGDIYDTLLNLFSEHKLYMIFVHSQNYYSSPISLNEMGAAWVLKSDFCSVLLPGFDYSDMKGVVDSSKISIKIDAERKTVQNLLNELYVNLSEFFSVSRDTSIVWEGERDEFIDKMNVIKVVTDSQISKEAEDILNEAEKDIRGEVLISRGLGGKTVQAGKKKMNEEGNRREETRMLSAVKELLSKGYIEQTGEDIYQITDGGYTFLGK